MYCHKAVLDLPHLSGVFRWDYGYNSVFCTLKTVGVEVPHICCWMLLVLHCYIAIVSSGVGDMIHIVPTVW